MKIEILALQYYQEIHVFSVQETQAIHMNMGQGSYIESSIPWVTGEDGYTTVIRGQLLLLEATTSMKYRSLLECETLDVSH